MPRVQISEEDLREILSEVGYPVIQLEDLEFSEDDVKDYFIYPALREYFTYFPKKEKYRQYIEGPFEVEFPDEFTFGLTDGRLNTTFGGASRSESPFLNEIMFNKRMGGSYNVYGTRNDYGFFQSRMDERMTRRTTLDYNKTFNIRVDESEGKVVGYSNINGELILEWAKFSDDVADVRYIHKHEFLNLAKAYTLRGFAQIRDQIAADTGADFDTSGFRNRFEDLEQKVLESWKQKSKVVILRG